MKLSYEAFAAVPPDVRKVSDLPTRPLERVLGCALMRAQPQNNNLVSRWGEAATAHQAA
jgi:hypothetical protein